MLFSTVFKLAALAVAAAQTKLQFTSVPGPFVIGEKALVAWTGGNGDGVTLTLHEGGLDNPKTVGIIASNIMTPSYNWTPAADIKPADDYQLVITQGLDTINYSGEFSIQAAANQTTTIYAVAGSSTSVVAVVTASSNSSSSSSSSSVSSSMNMTVTGAAASSSGTGTALPRNTTMSSPTLSTTATLVSTTTASSTGGAATAQAVFGLGAIAAGAVFFL